MIDSPWLLPALILNTLAMLLVFGLSWLVLGRYPLPFFRWWVRGAGWLAVAGIAGTLYVVYPQQQSANNSASCFNWFEPGDYTRGQGEALSIKQMVDQMTGTTAPKS